MRVLALILLAASLCQAQTGYSTDGSEVALKAPALPSYATVVLSGASTWTWGTGVTCFYSPTSFMVAIDAASPGHQVTFYMVDGDSTTRTETIQQYIGSTSNVTITTPFSGFSKGVYQSYNLAMGENVFTFTHTGGGANAVLTAIYFDTPTVAPQHQVILNWTQSATAGVSAQHLYRNGTLLASLGPTVTTYTDTTVQAGQTYYFTISALIGTTESVQTPVTGFTIPSP